MIGSRFEVRRPDGRPPLRRSRFRDYKAACTAADDCGGHVVDLTDGWSVVYQSADDQRWWSQHGEAS